MTKLLRILESPNQLRVEISEDDSGKFVVVRFNQGNFLLSETFDSEAAAVKISQDWLNSVKILNG